VLGIGKGAGLLFKNE